MRSRTARTNGLAGAALVVLVLTGCAYNGGGVVDDPQRRIELGREQDAGLRLRPTLEQEVARLTGARDAIRDQLAERLGLTPWIEVGNVGGSGCGDESSGEEASLTSLGLAGGVPEGQWQAAADLVEEVARTYGFGVVELVIDNPGNHELALSGEYGSGLAFGSGSVNAVLSLRTGCHLPAAVG